MTSLSFTHSRGPIIVGSGVAGLTTALAAEASTVLTKTGLGHGSSTLAQGGIAAAVGAEDTAAIHAEDTVAVSGGLADAAVAGLVTTAAPDRIRWLMDLGARFDHAASGELLLGREAGHRRNRIVHADGDATGAELMRTLRAAVQARPDVTVLEHTAVIDLVRSADGVAGVLTIDAAGVRRVILGPAVVVATGGIGRLYANTTNPAEVTGDGLAMAIRAGAVIRDPEFVQFHPTALRTELDPMPLLTEALRGDGATLVDQHGCRFMDSVHPDAELAPRDVVARAIWHRLDDGDQVFLDARHVGASFPDRFPTVFAAAIAADVDPRLQPLPVSPAAHYHMGGIAVDAVGRSSVPGLYACGEAAATGLHGANRLASNSLLEGLVFGMRTARAIEFTTPPAGGRLLLPAGAHEAGPAEATAAITQLRETMWRHVGVTRTADGLAAAQATLTSLGPELNGGIIGRNMLAVASLITTTALERTESRGGHYRHDHPAARDDWARSTYATVPHRDDHRTIVAEVA